MTTDIRKWMNLFEEEQEGIWHTHEELLAWLWAPEEWNDALRYIKEEHILNIGSDAFQHYIKKEFRPAWITSVRQGTYGFHPLVMEWLITEGPEDPDE